MLAIGLLVLFPRLGVEWQWFAQFDAQGVLLRRWLLQVVAFVLVLGLGIPLQLQQLQRGWRLRQAPGPKPLPIFPLVSLGPVGLTLLMGGVLLLLAGGLTYLLVQARDLIAEPFSGRVITGIPVLADLPPGCSSAWRPVCCCRCCSGPSPRCESPWEPLCWPQPPPWPGAGACGYQRSWRRPSESVIRSPALIWRSPCCSCQPCICW